MAGPTPARISIVKSGDTSIVSFQSNTLIDQVLVTEIEQQLLQHVGESHEPAIVLNFEEVSRASSTMIGVLFRLSQAVKRKAGKVRMAGLNEHLQAAVEVTNLHKLIQTFATIDDALATM